MAEEILVKPWAGLGFACPHCGHLALHEATRAEFDALEKHHEIERGARKRADLEVERLRVALAAEETERERCWRAAEAHSAKVLQLEVVLAGADSRVAELEAENATNDAAATQHEADIKQLRGTIDRLVQEALGASRG